MTTLDYTVRTLTEFAELATRPGSVCNRHACGDDFTGRVSLGGAARMVREGWPAGVAAILRMADELERRLAYTVKVEDWQYDVTGADFDIGRVMTGEPECWQAPTHREAPQPVSIVVNVFASCAIDHEIITARGATAAALALLLERSQRPVEIIAADICTNRERNGAKFILRVPVKRSGEPFDLSRIAFALTHPAFLRQLCFNAAAAFPGAERFGFPLSYCGCPADEPSGDIYLPGMTSANADFLSVETAVRWVLRYLEESGVLSA